MGINSQFRSQAGVLMRKMTLCPWFRSIPVLWRSPSSFLGQDMPTPIKAPPDFSPRQTTHQDFDPIHVSRSAQASCRQPPKKKPIKQTRSIEPPSQEQSPQPINGLASRQHKKPKQNENHLKSHHLSSTHHCVKSILPRKVTVQEMRQINSADLGACPPRQSGLEKTSCGQHVPTQTPLSQGRNLATKQYRLLRTTPVPPMTTFCLGHKSGIISHLSRLRNSRSACDT